MRKRINLMEEVHDQNKKIFLIREKEMEMNEHEMIIKNKQMIINE